ncbi:hypothetical protein [Mesocricetibacter intestinalis]|uniref:hypothetical protein n=1 Tax=Mesocricetibacter intestinalis TaxID=1521930 RepID=UPI001AAC8416|nr:hypothetical protein [Mesocricetibacter intestinalis]
MSEVKDILSESVLSRDKFIENYQDKTFNSKDINNGFIRELINHHINFSIKSSDISREALRVERIMEDAGYKCRIYTENRATAMGASFFGGITGAIGVVSAIGIAAHNLATYNPDFEIGKNHFNNQINITYKK